MKCFAHTLQLAVNEGLSLQTINNVVIHSRRLVAFFARSVVASQALEDHQKRLDKQPKRLIVDISTRWNSTYLC